MNVQRVIIADNQPVTAYAIEQLIGSLNSNIKVEHIALYNELAKALKESDLMTAVILDYTLFDFFNQEQLVLLAESNHDRAVFLLFSEDLTTGFLRYVLYNTENIGVIFKDAPLEMLKVALQYTIRGEQYVSQHATKVLFQKAYKEEQHKDELTQTERDVLKLIALGKTTKEIAAERYSSINTINSHRKNIFRKLNVNCAHDAIKYALRSGLVEEAEFYI